MAFLKENLNAFVNQPVEKKRSDHRLKKTDSVVDTRAWILNEELKRQQFLNVVNQTGDGDAEEGGEPKDIHGPRSSHLIPTDSDIKIGDQLKRIEEEKNFLKNVIADKENEIERLLLRIHTMAEVEDSSGSSSEASVIQKQLNDLIKQYNAKEDELKKTKDVLNNTEKMLKDLQSLIESTGEDPQKQKAQLDNVMKGLQTGMQDDIEQLQNALKELEEKLKNSNDENSKLRSELAALASGDENELSKTIMGLRNELDKVKMSKDAENEALKDAFSQKEDELKALKNMLNQQNKEDMFPFEPQEIGSKADIELLKQLLSERDNEIKQLKDQLENEKKQNIALKEDLNLLADKDDSGLKNKILALTAELDNLRTQASTQFQPDVMESPGAILSNEDLENKVRDLENLLQLEKEQNKKLKKELANEKEKYNQMALGDDNELRKLLADAEKKIEELNKDKEDSKSLVKSPVDQASSDGKSPVSLETNKVVPEMAGDYEQLRKENIELKDENNKLKSKIKKLQEIEDPENAKDLLRENESLRNQNEGLKSENEILKKAIKDQEQHTGERSKLPDISSTEKGPLEIRKDELLEENSKLKNELEALKKQFSTTLQTEPQLETKNEENKGRINQLENENEKLKLLLKEEKDKCNEAIGDKEKNIDRLKDELNKVNKENSNLAQEIMKNKEGQQLSSEDKEIDDLMKKLNKLESDYDNLKTEKDNCNDNILQKDKNMNKLQDEIKKLKGEKENLEKELNKLKDSPQGMPSSSLNTSASSPDQEHDVKKCMEDKQKLENEIDKLKQTLESAQKDQAQNQVPVIKSNEGQDAKLLNEISSLTHQNKMLKDNNEKLKQDLENKQKELENLKKNDEKPISNVAVKKEQMATPDAISKDLQEENLKLKTKIKELEDKIKEMQSNYAEANLQSPKGKDQTLAPDSDKESSHIKNENLKLVKNNEDQKKEISDLKKRLKEAESNNLELQNENDKMLKLLNKAEETGGISGNEVLDMCKSNLEKLKKENSNLKKRIAELENELENVKKICESPDDIVKLETKGSSQKATEGKHDKLSDPKLPQTRPVQPPQKQAVAHKDIDDSGKPFTSIKETPKDQPSTPKVVDKSDKPLTPKKETPKGQPLTQGKVDDAKASISKKDITKEEPSTQKNIDKRDTGPTQKKGVQKEEPISKTETVDIGKTSTPKKETPTGKPTSQEDGKIDKDFVPKTGMPKEQPVTAKDIIDKTANKEKSKTPEPTQTSQVKSQLPKKGTEDKIQTKPDVGKSPQTIDSTPKDKQPLAEKEKTTFTEKPKSKDGKILSEKETVKPRENIPDKKAKPGEKVKEQKDLDDGQRENVTDKKVKPGEKVRTEAKEVDDGKRDNFPDKKAKPGGKVGEPKDLDDGKRKNVPDKNVKAGEKVRIEAKDLDDGKRENVLDKKAKPGEKVGEPKDLDDGKRKYVPDKKVKPGEKVRTEADGLDDGVKKSKPEDSKLKLKKEALSDEPKLVKGVEVGDLDYVTQKEKAKKRKRDVTEEKKEQDDDEYFKEKFEDKLSTVEKIKPKKAMKKLKDVEKGSKGLTEKIIDITIEEEYKKPFQPNIFETQKDVDTMSLGHGDEELDNELSELKKKLNEAEKLIKQLKNENVLLKTKIDGLKQVDASREEKGYSLGEYDKFLGEDAKKLNKILRKAITYGLKTLYLDELEFVHDSLNDTMANRNNMPRTPGTKSPEELEKIINNLERKMASLLSYLKSYRQLSSEHSKKNMEYSRKVQHLNTDLGLQQMSINSLLRENQHLRDLLSNEKDRVKNLENMLKHVLDDCKCIRKSIFNQYYPGLRKTGGI